MKVMELETIIGLEIHVQLNSKSKLFSPTDNDAWGAAPNTRVHPFDMGFPGMLPVLNKEALLKGALASAALGCDIQPYSKFDRKNYFYPDLPCGYQITQFDEPIALNGAVTVEVNGEEKTFNLTRLHLEIDAGKLSHSGKGTMCDYNRSGTPLAEIVTEPEMRSPEDAVALAKEIQKIVRFVNASDADMEKGMMRFDASVSLRPKGDEKLYPRAEIKNLNSFTSLGKAIAYEVKRQSQLWHAGTPPTTEQTVGWLDDQEKTQLLRDKESAHDYRYFPEPDLPPVTFTAEEIQSFVESVPELPFAKYKRYKVDFQLSDDVARVLSETPLIADFFEASIADKTTAKKAANIICKVLLAETYWHNSEITPQHVLDVVRLINEGAISSSAGNEILKEAMKTGADAMLIMKEKGLEQNSDTGQLETWIAEVIAVNEKSVEDYKAGKEKALMALMGQVMKKSKGSANPALVMQLLKKSLS